MSDEPLTDYEEQRLSNLMANNRRFQALGINNLANILRSTTLMKENHANADEGSASEYDPEEDQEQFDDDQDEELQELQHELPPVIYLPQVMFLAICFPTCLS